MGVPQFRGDTSVEVNPSEDVAFEKVEKTADLASGGLETVKIGPPAGEIWEVHTIHISIASTGGTGGHSIDVKSETFDGLNLLAAQNDGSSGLLYNFGYWSTLNASYSQKRPDNQTVANQIVKGIRLDQDNTLRFEYSNPSGNANTNDRVYGVYVRKIQQ